MRKKRKLSFKLILTLLLISLIIIFIFSFKFKNVIIEPPAYAIYLENLLKNKTIFQEYFSIKKIILDFPEIKKIEVKQNFFKQSLILKIQPATIIATICDQEKCLFLDDSNQIIQPRIKPQNNLLKIESSLKIKESSQLHPELSRLFLFLFEYSNLETFILRKIKIYPNFDVGVIDKYSREFLFDPSQNLEEQFKKLHLVLNDKKISATRIDLRIPKKIYLR